MATRRHQAKDYVFGALLDKEAVASRAATKQGLVCVVLFAVAGMAHLGQGIFFYLQGLTTVAAVNVASVGCYVVAIVLTRRRRVLTGIVIVWVELFIYITALTIVFTLRAGFAAYYLSLMIVPFMLFQISQRRLRLLWFASFLVSGIIAYTLGDRSYALVDVSDEVLEQLGTINLATNILVLIIGAGYFAYASEQAERASERERQRSETLLLNILPPPVAERLKREPGVIADAFPMVTVLFSDLVGFTTLSSRVSTDKLIEMLNEVFSRFDRLAKKHGIEKIKTIGDAYMAVGGVPLDVEDHAAKTVAMGLEMVDELRRYSEEVGEPLDLRIGVHTGPVVAGVIGVEKFAYDLWGDTVNTASRMESHGAPGRVQISQATRDQLGERFLLEDRGEIEVKGKGLMHTYFVNAPDTPGATES